MGNISNEYIGAMCANYRKYELDVPQRVVAEDCRVSRELVSKFERGSIPNSLVFMWYIKNGLFDWVPVDHWCGWGGYGFSD
jgi:hypothetical protein